MATRDELNVTTFKALYAKITGQFDEEPLQSKLYDLELDTH
jgi:hypothetical protein